MHTQNEQDTLLYCNYLTGLEKAVITYHFKNIDQFKILLKVGI